MIIDFFKKKKLSRKKNNIKDWQCSHKILDIDEHRRLLVCHSCGQFIEPYDYMIKISDMELQLDANIVNSKKTLSDLTSKINNSKKELNSLQDKIKRLKNKI